MPYEKDTNAAAGQGDGHDASSRRLADHYEIFQQMAENIREVFWLFDWQEQRVVYVSPAYEEIWGRPTANLYDRYDDWADSIHPEDREYTQKSFARAIETGGGEPREYRIIRQDGCIRWVSDRAFAIRDDRGQVRHIAGIAEDITSRKEAEDRIRESEERFRSLVEQAPFSTVVYRPDGTVRYGNAAAMELHGITEDQYQYVLEEYNILEDEVLRKNGLLPYIRRAFAGQPQSMPPTQFEPDDYPSDPEGRARRRWMEGVIYPIADRAGRVVDVVLIHVDITDRKQVEQQLIHLERLRAACELSAGISHNLNNILTGVLGPAQLLKTATHDPEVLRDIDMIISSAGRATDLVSRLHRATRGQEEQDLGPVDVNRVAQDSIAAARPRWHDESSAKGIEIRIVTDLADVPPIHGTDSALHDIFVNLLLNAVDALPEGGTISVSTRSLGQEVQIRLADTGIGMDDETFGRVFEPFFTTKMEVGTGLGLSTVHGTVSSWGGSIDVDSSPGKGTTFTILLPACREAAADANGVGVRAAERRARILVVEDDEVVGQFLARLLGQEHSVSVFQDSRSALERFEAGTYDVAMIDLGMPGITGDRLVRQLRQIDDRLVTVLITGWAIERDDPRLAPFDFQIPKPFGDVHLITEAVANAVKLYDSRNGGAL